MKLKMSDIAKMANVSRSAVSLALNGKPGVSTETRKRIFEIIDEQGYKPLRKRKKGGVRKLASINLIIVSDKKGIVNRNYRSLPFFDHLVSSLTQNVSGFGGQVQIDTLMVDSLADDLKRLLKNTVIDNAVVLGTDLEPANINYINSQIKHVVFVDTYYDDINADFVTMNNFQGTYMAANYLIKKGYRKIGYAASNKLISNFMERRRGFKQALKEKNINIPQKYFYSIDPTKLTPDSKIEEFSTKDLPEVIFCEDDYMALRLMKEFIKKGLNIPDDIAIMGFDDIYEGVLVTPELTTIHVPIDQIVNQVINQLQGQVADSNWEPQKCLISTRLIERESV
ncbi:LacI family DNA-binding transcriptional regulator [Lactobacillus crispatus]|uniref:LacI family transcriptional regulator n=1 Tax=Lactobacillus crispatus TaxID=47770 RepID=A0A109DD18_9LACO|nr:LacI family DNA-binding transcriptional regulator [Lactobacillus crispatus]KWU03178.1 LacI family transcriptional regulator [Lactobacillus crispatus]